MAKKKTSKSRGTQKKTVRKAKKAPTVRTKKSTARKSSKKKTKRSAGSSPKKSTATASKSTASRKVGRKSPLTARELRQYAALLRQKRVEILGDMTSMSRDALNSDSANLSHMPIHMADVGSDNYEQELTLGLVESERKLLQEIDEALERLDEGTYGICHATGKPIGKARLNAKPWAKYCIEAARELERNGGRRW